MVVPGVREERYHRGMTAFDLDFGRPTNARIEVGSGWGMRSGRMHEAVDIALPERTPILAVQDGVVIRSQKTPVDDAGVWVGIQHPPYGAVTRYMHLARADVELGQQVRKGQQIGLSGNTGRSDLPHLHLALHVPAAVLPQLQAAVGKPKDGWGRNWERYGVAVPIEPWLPVDAIRPATAAKLGAQFIPLYSQRIKAKPPILARLPPAVASLSLPLVLGLAVVGGIAAFAGYRIRQLRSRAT